MKDAFKTGLVTAALIVLGAGCPRTTPVSDLPTVPPTPVSQTPAQEAAPVEAVAHAGNLFDPLVVRPGDSVAGLKIVSVSGLDPTAAVEEGSYRVTFEGRVTVSGTYDYHFSDFAGGGEVLFTPDAAGLAKLPITKERLEHPVVYLSGGLTQILRILNVKKGSYGTGAATLLLRDYSVVWAPAEVMDSATLVGIEFEKVPVLEAISLEPYYVAYTAEGASRALKEGRATVLYFWASWCPICRADEPKIKARIEGSDLPVAGFRVNYDVESDLKAKYKIPYQHTAVFLDKTGAEVERLSGPVDDATFLAALKKAAQ